MAAQKVYLVVQRHWDYDDEFWTGGDTPVLAYRSREAAQRYCDQREFEEFPVDPDPKRDQRRAWILQREQMNRRAYIVVEAEVDEESSPPPLVSGTRLG
jgi:hypothetical protein